MVLKKAKVKISKDLRQTIKELGFTVEPIENYPEIPARSKYKDIFELFKKLDGSSFIKILKPKKAFDLLNSAWKRECSKKAEMNLDKLIDIKWHAGFMIVRRNPYKD